ncbi:hypothetical protein [Peribacillus simplex]
MGYLNDQRHPSISTIFSICEVLEVSPTY